MCVYTNQKIKDNSFVIWIVYFQDNGLFSQTRERVYPRKIRCMCVVVCFFFVGYRIKGKNQKVNGNKSKGHLQYIKLARKMVIQLQNRFNGCGIVFSTRMVFEMGFYYVEQGRIYAHQRLCMRCMYLNLSTSLE